MRAYLLFSVIVPLASAIHLKKSHGGPFDKLVKNAGGLAKDLKKLSPYAIQGVKHTFEHVVLGLNTSKKVTEKELPPNDYPDKMKYEAVQVHPISVPESFGDTNIVLVGDSNDREAARWLCENLSPEGSKFRFHHHFARDEPVEKDDVAATWNAKNTHGIAICDLPRQRVSIVSFFHFGVFLNGTSGSTWNDWGLSMIPQPVGEEMLPVSTVEFVKKLDAQIVARVLSKAAKARGESERPHRRTLVLTNSHLWDVIPALVKGSTEEKEFFKTDWLARAENLMQTTISTFESAEDYAKAPNSVAFAWRTQGKCPFWVKDTQDALERMAEEVREAHKSRPESVFSKVALVDWRNDEHIDRKNEGEKCYNAFPELSPTTPLLAEKDKLAIHMKSYSQFWHSVFEHDYNWYSNKQ